MAPVIQKFLVEGSSLVTYAGRDKESLIQVGQQFILVITQQHLCYSLQYLDKNMIILKEELNASNFERVLAVIWESSAQSLHDTIMLSIDVTLRKIIKYKY